LWRVELAPQSREKIGWIEERNDSRFHIIAGVDDDPDRRSPIWGVDHGPHERPEDALAAIACELGGACEKGRP
jgi:hypothetical protein